MNPPSTVVTIGGAPLVGQTILDSTRITGTTPPLPSPTSADVVLTTPGGGVLQSGAVDYDHAVFNLNGSTNLGGSFEIGLASYAAKPVVLLADTVPGPTQVGAYGFVGLGLSPALVPILDFFGAFTGTQDPSAALDGSGRWSATVTVPNEPALVGMSAYGQGYVFSVSPFPPNTLFFMTNTLTVTFVP